MPGSKTASSTNRSSIYDGDWHDAPLYDRNKLHAGIVVPGPSIVMEMDSTTVILPDHEAKVDDVGNLLINPSEIRGGESYGCKNYRNQ